MKTWRAIVCLQLCLLLVGQSVAAFPLWTTVFSKHGMAHVSAMADLPCHKGMLKEPLTSGQKRSCCDKSCPDMTACALSQPATLAADPFVFPQATSGAVAHNPTFTPANRPNPLFRPPITLHG